jgi:hypothetical protein
MVNPESLSPETIRQLFDDLFDVAEGKHGAPKNLKSILSKYGYDTTEEPLATLLRRNKELQQLLKTDVATLKGSKKPVSMAECSSCIMCGFCEGKINAGTVAIAALFAIVH